MSFRQLKPSVDNSDLPFGIDHKVLLQSSQTDTTPSTDEALTTDRTKMTDDTLHTTSVVEVPISIQSIITQSDSSGNQIRREVPSYDVESGANHSQFNNPIPNHFTSPTVSFSRYLCYCFSRDKPPIGTLRSRLSIRGTSPITDTNSSSSSSSGSGYRPSTQPTSSFRASFRQSLTVANRPLPLSVPEMGEILPQHVGKKLLALDLDETLVHSSFQPVQNANYIIPVNIDGTVHNVFVLKRPGVDEFMKRLSEYYEIVVYTASLSKYADPLLDELDKDKLISKRLFRENCVFYNGHYVKDLSLFTNRDLSQTIIIDNSPMSYIFQPDNAIDCSSFIDSPTDIEMWQIADFLIAISKCDDVRKYCRRWREWCQHHPSTIP